MHLTNEQKFEALKYRHEDMSKLLQLMTNLDLRIIISFLTLQLVLGGFLSQAGLNEYGKYGILLIDITLSLICIKFLFNNYKRRIEATKTIENCNIALGFVKEGFYIENVKINYTYKFRPWFWLYFVCILISTIGIIIILFFPSLPNCVHHSPSLIYLKY